MSINNPFFPTIIIVLSFFFFLWNNLELRVINYILYGNGKPIRGISGTSIQLVRTCLVLNWDRDKKKTLLLKKPALPLLK